MGSKEQMNMGGERSTTSAFVQLNNVLDSLVNKVNTLRSGGAGFAASMAAGAQKISAASGDVDGGGNQVFSQPPVQPPPASTVAGMGGGGFGNRIGNYVSDNRGAIGATAFGATYTSLPAVNDAVTMDFLINRTRFFGGGGGTASGDRSYNNLSIGAQVNNPSGAARNQGLEVQRRQELLSSSGTVTNPLDAAKAFLAAQSGGVGQSFMNDKMIQGVGAMSNLTPGVGVERSMQAMTAMQQPRNVNLLAFMGIQARDPLTGQPKDPKAIAQQLWDKINREKMGSEPLTAEDLDTSFLPGNSLDSMMKMYFGNDEVVVSQIKAFLYAKVAGVTKMTKKELKKYGATTGYVESQSGRSTAAMKTLQQVSSMEAAGAAASNVLAEGFSDVVNAVDRLTNLVKLASGIKGFVEGLKGIPIIGNVMPKADGGPVAGRSPYLVGEKGPELFVPKVDGTIIPNHNLGITRGDGGDVSKLGASLAGSQEGMSNKDLRTILSAAGFKDKNIEDAIKIVRAESGGIPGRHSDPSLKKDDSYGLFQINMLGQLGVDRHKQYLEQYGKYGYKKREDLYNPEINARIAADLSGKGNTFDKHWVNSVKKLELGNSSSSSGSSFASQAGPIGSFKDFIMQNSSIAGDMARNEGQKGGNVITININGYNKSGKELAKEVVKIMEDPTRNAGRN